MGDRRHSSSAYLYIQHPLPIHSVDRQTKQRASLVEQPPAGLNLWTPPYSPFVHSPAHALHAPPYLLLHPFLQLARIDELQPAASHTPLPAVIVSPHSLSPPPQRDSARLLPKKQPAKSAPAPKDTADGNKESQCSVQSSAPTMTSNGAPATNMASKREEAGAVARAQRPSIVSHHSNSVPSTPLQVARRYDTHSRSPSPNGGLGSHSPRSVASEANSTMPTLRPARPVKCKFETNVGSLGRRRMPYHSSDILEKAKDEPKKTLDPHEDDKLSGDMRELYDRIQPTQENTAVRNKFVAKVQRILETEFPGNEFKVSIFGSSGNMLWTAESDVDICIQTPMKRLEEMHMLAEALDKHGMERVVCIPAAKVRIVKVWDPELQLSCDMNVNNVAALENTRMINLYVQIDDRVRPLAMIVKHWTKRRILNDAGSFADDLEALRGFGKSNAESLGQLLFHFFRLYGHEVDYEKIVVSVRQGCRIQREEKNWHPGGGQKEGVNRLCVEEPFSTDRNLGNSADDYAWRGIHLEIRRAFDLLADSQQLEKACEQYEFPAQEQSSSIFKKPQSQKATITSSVPTRNGRGGSNHRGGRGGFNSRNQNNNGRRSSGSNSYLQGRPPFLHSPPISAGPGQEYFAFSRGPESWLKQRIKFAAEDAPLLNTALRRVSRSPSPLGGHMRSYSTGVHDPNVAVNDQRKARVDSVRPPVDSGPVIVNGSFPTPPREPRIRSDTIESLPPDLSKTNGLGIFSNQQAMHQINEIQARQQMVLEEMQRHKIAAADSMGPPIVNGSTRSSPSAESNGLTRVPSEGQQSFPPLPEGWMAYEASNGQKNSHNEEISPKRTLPPQWRTPAYTNGLPSLDTSNPARMPPQEVKSATLPLLSPVFETRTPSPSASRPNDAGKLINGVKAQAKDTSQQNRRASHTPPSNASKENRNGQQKGKAQQQGTENGSKSAGTNHNGSWQQQPIRNARNSKKNKKKSAEQKNTGEPLPANAADRKGG
ncbi:hypothetical protein SNOG_13807 [Parastagonospora nodorum SN15]|uniref:polynucleotide adenylyltransferase n=1 Tax=Phaeosphaeria nodorum (strain SN15 / ATCC MYA-4574 / FGSC 10173) TaxID=321614 RepID=Q0U357_PHANO|nr:hypothetical protein SNOG_13807 [Parastagonospora nodorum SN15]EAT78831.2 hypothetical protein SNOG_13807 [Parastagonospora nodorum SN15]